MNEEKSGTMVATEQGSYYYHADHLGSSSVVTDVNGKFYEQIEYFPYGETWIHNKANTEQQSTPYKFTSKELDEETGLYYYGARYYDARLSRWISADPVMQHLNLFTFCRDNPIRYFDPDGNADIETPWNYFLANTFGDRTSIQIGYRVTADNGDFRFSDAGWRAAKNAIPLYGVINELSDANYGGAIREGGVLAGTTMAAGALTKGLVRSTLLGALLSEIISESYYQVSRKFNDQTIGELSAFAADHLSLYAYARAHGCAITEFENGKTTMYTGDTDKELVSKRLAAIKELLNPTLQNIKSLKKGELYNTKNANDYVNFNSLSKEEQNRTIKATKAVIYNENPFEIWPAGKGWAYK